MEGIFSVKVGEFEGPLDLLLSLIEKKKMHIGEIPLAQVADDYIAYLRDAGDVPAGKIADFLLIASTLMLIKSVALLPNLELTPEEKESMEDLEARLRNYERLKELAVGLKKIFGKEVIFLPEESRPAITVFAPGPEITLDNISASAHFLLTNLPKKEKIPEVTVRKIISLEEVVSNLAERIQKSLKMKWSDFSSEHKGDRVGIIVSFLGMLELVKRGAIEVRQDALFRDIDIETRKTDVPRYC